MSKSIEEMEEDLILSKKCLRHKDIMVLISCMAVSKDKMISFMSEDQYYDTYDKLGDIEYFMQEIIDETERVQ